MNESLNNQFQHHQLVINNVFPDCSCLSFHFFIWVILKNKHGCENLMFCLHWHIFRLGFNNVVFKFFDELIHKNWRRHPDSGVFREHHSEDRLDKLVRWMSGEWVNANFDSSHAYFATFVFIVSETINHQWNEVRKPVNEFIETIGQEDKYTSIGFPKFSFLILRFNHNFFNIYVKETFSVDWN
jgi:hypothetical protein